MGEAPPCCAPCQVQGDTTRQGNLQKLPSTASIQGLLKLEQIAYNMFMLALSLSSEQLVTSVCITYWAFSTLPFAYKMLLSAEFDSTTDILAIQLGTVSADTYRGLTKREQTRCLTSRTLLPSSGCIIQWKNESFI